MDNEQIFCDLLPEAARIYENQHFENSLMIFMKNIRFGREFEKKNEDSEIFIENLRCLVEFEDCRAVLQKKIEKNDEKMFGKVEDLKNESDEELSDLNISEQNFRLKIKNLFGCSDNQIIIRQPILNQIYLQINFKKEKQTSRSIIFEAILILFEFLSKNNQNITRIGHLIFPFVHFGKIRIFMEINDQQIAKAQLFNCFGTVFGVFQNIGSKNDEKIEENSFLTQKQLEENHFKISKIEKNEEILIELLSILKNQMKINHEINENDQKIPISYIGIDSIRIVELEFFILKKWPKIQQKIGKGKAFLIKCRNLNEIVLFIKNLLNEPEVNEIEIKNKQLSKRILSEKKNYKIPLSSQQKRILFIIKSNPSTTELNEEFRIKFKKSSYNSAHLLFTLNYLIQQNSIFRTKYLEDFQFILSATESFVGIFEELTPSKNYRSNHEFESLKIIGENSKQIRLIFNHICIDGKSLSIFYKEFQQIYNGNLKKIPINKIPQYSDFCFKNGKKNHRNEEKENEFWKNYLKNVNIERLKTDFCRNQKLGKIQSINVPIPIRIQEKINKICQKFEVSKFEVFISIVQLVIQKIFGIDQFSLGYVNNQRSFEFSKTIGCFSNILPLICDLENKKFDEILKKTQNDIQNGRSFSLEFEQIYQIFKKGKQREAEEEAEEEAEAEEEEAEAENIFDILIISDIIGENQSNQNDEIEIIEIKNEIDAKYEICWYLKDDFIQNSCSIQIDFSTNLYHFSTIQHLLMTFLQLLNQIIIKEGEELKKKKRKIGRKISDFPKLTISQISQFSYSNSTLKIDYKNENSEINENMINQLSKYLLLTSFRTFGDFSIEKPILLKLKRNQFLIKIILSCWKCGFYPFPIHKNTTNIGLKKIMEILKSDWIIKNNEEAIEMEKINKIQYRLMNRLTLFDISYLTTTSGSTGNPKLVVTSFEGHSNLAKQYSQNFMISSKNAICQIVDPSFDIFFADLTKTFVNGCSLILCENEICSKSELAKSTNAYLMPAVLSRIDPIILQNLESIQFGGECLPSTIIEKIRENNEQLRCWQEFGLTEQTVYSFRKKIRESNDLMDIGIPYDNIQAICLTKNGEEITKIGFQANLVLKGVGLMRGHFGANFNKNQQIHELLTGDEVEINENGQIRFVGRKDSQIKIRGHRIDLFEIESIVLSLKLISEAICIISNQNQIILFYTTNHSKIEEIEKKMWKILKSSLIQYKIPKKLINLNVLPLTRTGKIDKNQLKSMEFNEKKTGRGRRRKEKLVENDEEIRNLVRKWIEYYSEIKIEDDDENIFKNGVDSISIMLSIQKLKSAGFKMENAIKTFFKLKTIRKIAGWIEKQQQKVEKYNFQEKSKNQLIDLNQNRFIDLNHIQKRILFLCRFNSSKIFRMEFPIDFRDSSNPDKIQRLLNKVICQNPLLRSDLQRINGNYCFLIKSLTESFMIFQKRQSNNQINYNVEIWKNDYRFYLSIHHLICDGRSLQILKNQLIDEFENESKNQWNLDEFNLKEEKLPKDFLIENPILLFPNFIFGSNSTRFIFTWNLFEQKNPAEISFQFSKVLSKVFSIKQRKFNVAITFMNRNIKNWNTVSMFANTLPIQFDTEIENINSWSQKFQFYNEKLSNIPLKEFLKKPGLFSDFAINFHKDRDEIIDQQSIFAQFPLLMTFCEKTSEIIIDYSENEIRKDQIILIQKYLNSKNQENQLNIEEIVHKSIRQILKIEEKIDKNFNFFTAGGHSLTAMKLIDSISDQLNIDLSIRLIFDHPIIDDFIQQIEQKINEKTNHQNNILIKKPLKISMEKYEIPLSPQQNQMIYVSELTSSTTEYQLPFIQEFPSNISIQNIHLSFIKTIQEQSIFRTGFYQSKNGILYQKPLSITETFLCCHIINNENIDLSHQINKLCSEKIEVLSGKSLCRATFIRSSKKSIAFFHVHHLISDARTTQIVNETMQKFMKNQSINAKQLKYNYFDYCKDILKENHHQIINDDNQYIQSIINGIIEADKIGIKNQEMLINRKYLEIPTSSIQFDSTSTPFLIFLQIFSEVFLNFFSSKKIDSINIAFPTISRTDKTIDICGYFLNNLIINSSKIDNISEIISNNYQFSKIVQLIRQKIQKPDASIAEIYLNCRYDLEYDESDSIDLLEMIPIKIHFPIEIDIDSLPNVWKITIRSTFLRNDEILEIFEMVRNKIEKKSTKIGEKTKKCRIINGERHDFPIDGFPRLLQNFFSSDENSTTSLFGKESKIQMNYEDAGRKIILQSKIIRKQILILRGIQLRNDDNIGIIDNKSISTTLLCLSVQLSGSSFVPIDFSYPKIKIQQILKSTSSIAYICNDDIIDSNIPLIQSPLKINKSIIKSKLLMNCLPIDMSYVITTSGTTGTPKCVGICGESQSNLCLSSTLSLNVNSSSRIFQFTNFVFDNSILETTMSICNQSILIYDQQNNSTKFDISTFSELINSGNISHCLLFPSLVETFSISKLRLLPYWIVGGEKLSQKLLDEALNIGCHVIQNYGPTETTAFAITKRMRINEKSTKIGKPTFNSNILINENGEILINGNGMMRGYFSGGKQSFQNYFGQNWYSSGDLCEISNQSINEIIFKGRKDSQIKIRGFRVELDEVENCIQSHPSIQLCKTIFDSETQQILAFFIQNDENVENLREFCSNRLEYFKIPSIFKRVSEFPLTSNSKIDWKKLMQIGRENQSNFESSEINNLSSSLSLIWSNLLQIDSPKKSDHFFLLGGHSLLLIRLRHQIQTFFDIKLSVSEILENLKFEHQIQLIQSKLSKRYFCIFFPALYGGCVTYQKLSEKIQKSTRINIFLDEEFGENVDEVAKKYQKQIEQKCSNADFMIFIGASSAGTFAFATSLLFNSTNIRLLLIDSGTFWNLIPNFQYKNHQKDVTENLRKFQIDEETIEQLCQTSWKTLQTLKNYEPKQNFSKEMFILSIDGSDLGWEKYTKNKFEVIKINGDHYNMLQNEENIQIIQEIIENFH